jgi:acetyl-CoA synthetase
MPKMENHNFITPSAHIVTAKYCRWCRRTSSYERVLFRLGHFGWGKIYGSGPARVNFAYDMDKYVPARHLARLELYKVTTFCAPPR